MKLVFIVTVLVASVASYEPIGRFYHKNVGIPAAAAIKAAEEKELATGRIAGGSYSKLGEHPYFAGLLIYLNNGETSVCGSTLLSNTKVLTSASCVNDGLYWVDQIEVVLGSIKLFGPATRVLVTSVSTHPGYDSIRIENNLAMLTIPWVTSTDNIKPINLPSDAEWDNTYAGATAQAVGFGKTSDWFGSITTSPVLRHVDLTVITNADCAKSYNGITGGDICTRGHWFVNVCGGDMGGPLSIRNSNGQEVLIGVVSFRSGLGCDWGSPSGYSRVTAFVPWIRTML